MRKIWLAVFAALLMMPSTGFAKDWKHRDGHGHGHYYRHSTVIVRKSHNYNGAAITAGVLGGIATGIILDRVVFPPPQPVYYPPSPPRAPRDPYDAGYSEGYNEGVERGQSERYERGRRQGYREGYEDSRAGRRF